MTVNSNLIFDLGDNPIINYLNLGKMINETDLVKLKYQVITRTKDNDNSLELVHQDFDERSYLVKLRKGEVYIVYPQVMQITKQPCFKTRNLDELIAWHNHY